MRSVGTCGVTIVTIITLIFTTFFGKDHKLHTQLVGTRVAQQTVQCEPWDPCPPFQVVFRIEYRQ